jgi:signal transduction histidine kinase
MRKLLSRIITVQEEERRRIARDLHDHLGQQMTALHLQLAIVAQQLTTDPATALERLQRVQALAKQLDKHLDFYTWELGPGALYYLGLVPALTDSIAAFSGAYRLPVNFESHRPDARLHSDDDSTCTALPKKH